MLRFVNSFGSSICSMSSSSSKWNGDPPICTWNYCQCLPYEWRERELLVSNDRSKCSQSYLAIVPMFYWPTLSMSTQTKDWLWEYYSLSSFSLLHSHIHSLSCFTSPCLKEQKWKRCHWEALCLFFLDTQIVRRWRASHHNPVQRRDVLLVLMTKKDDHCHPLPSLHSCNFGIRAK